MFDSAWTHGDGKIPNGHSPNILGQTIALHAARTSQWESTHAAHAARIFGGDHFSCRHPTELCLLSTLVALPAIAIMAVLCLRLCHLMCRPTVQGAHCSGGQGRVAECRNTQTVKVRFRVTELVEPVLVL